MATLDEVEAALWRRGLAADAVDEVLTLVRAVVATEAVAGAGWLGQAGSGVRGGERLSEGLGTGGEAEPRPGGSGEPEPGPELAAELAGKQAGSAVGEGPGTGSDAHPYAGWTDGPLSREGVSTDPLEGSGEGPLKACGSCGERQPLDRFYRDGNKADGHRGTCKGCEAARRRVRRRELAAIRWLVAAGADPWELLAAAERRVPVVRERGGGGPDATERARASALDLEALADALRASLVT